MKPHLCGYKKHFSLFSLYIDTKLLYGSVQDILFYFQFSVIKTCRLVMCNGNKIIFPFDSILLFAR